MQKKLIVMLKYPRPGAVKTRLIPALGEHRACALYRTLVARTLEEVSRFARRGEVSVEIRLTGAPEPAAARAWLGAAWVIRDQGDGDLGGRMALAVATAFAEGAPAVVVIGADCPQLTAETLAQAFAALDRAETVLGPAFDGGYYLIGLRRFVPELFREIVWSTAAVLAQSLAAAKNVGASHALLDPLSDLDEPVDLPIWARTGAARQAGLGGISVIVPALNEAAELARTLAAAQLGAPHEIIVVDGGSTDATRLIARERDAIVLSGPCGRAVQMNLGAAVATGEFLLFLHADTLLPADYVTHIRQTLAQPGVVAGAFKFAVAGKFTGRRLIEWATNRRAHLRQLPYGDQGLFVRRETFDALGGFPGLPILEDYEFVRRLHRLGRIAISSAVASTSGRRWQKFGVVRTTLLNQAILLGYHLGVPSKRLADWYRGAGSGTPASLWKKTEPSPTHV